MVHLPTFTIKIAIHVGIPIPYIFCIWVLGFGLFSRPIDLQGEYTVSALYWIWILKGSRVIQLGWSSKPPSRVFKTKKRDAADLPAAKSCASSRSTNWQAPLRCKWSMVNMFKSLHHPLTVSLLMPRDREMMSFSLPENSSSLQLRVWVP